MSEYLIAERPHPAGGQQGSIRFPNGYGASIVRTPSSYGGDEGLWELAVVIFTGESPWSFQLTHETPITSDVLGWLTEEEVIETLRRIDALPSRFALSE